MNDDPTNLVLARLSLTEGKLDRLLDRVGEFTTRLGSVKALAPHIHGVRAAQFVRIDRLSNRIAAVK